MAIKQFRFAYDNEKLAWLLDFSISAMVIDDLERFDWPGRVSNLEHLFKGRGFGHELSIDFDFLPSNTELPVEFVLICYRDFKPGDEEAALFSIQEFESELFDQLLNRSVDDAAKRVRALEIIRRLQIEKHGD